MKPDRVSLSCDSNPYYLEFWEPVSRIWKHKFGVDPYLFYIGDPQTAPANEHGTVVSIKPIDGIPVHTQAQWARFHFTQTEPDCVWITSDIDMFPLSRFYFLELANGVIPDCFVSLNSDLRNYFPVCYNMALGRVFKEVLQMEDTFEQDVKKVFSAITSDSHIVEGKVLENWSADERYSSAKICEHRTKYPHRVAQFVRPGGYQSARRIDRANWQYDPSALLQDWYLDCHSLRPYRDHRDRIESLLKVAMNAV